MADRTMSTFSANLKILGQIKTPDDIDIHCEVEGPVDANNVTISEGGFVRGFVRSKRLVVAGTLVGDFLGEEVEVTDTGRINGDVVCQSMSVDKNGAINGKCIMTDAVDAARIAEDGESRNLIKPIFANRAKRRGRSTLLLRPDDEITPLEVEARESHEA